MFTVQKWYIFESQYTIHNFVVPFVWQSFVYSCIFNAIRSRFKCNSYELIYIGSEEERIYGKIRQHTARPVLYPPMYFVFK